MPTVSVLPASTRPSGAGRRSRRGPSAGLEIPKALLGLGAMATALLGPLALGWIDYYLSSGAADQLRGGDVAGWCWSARWRWPPPGGSQPADLGSSGAQRVHRTARRLPLAGGHCRS